MSNYMFEVLPRSSHHGRYTAYLSDLSAISSIFLSEQINHHYFFFLRTHQSTGNQPNEQTYTLSVP
jgi:hypothetical protein